MLTQMANAVTNLTVKWGLQLMIQSLQEEPGLPDQILLQLPGLKVLYS